MDSTNLDDPRVAAGSSLDSGRQAEREPSREQYLRKYQQHIKSDTFFQEKFPIEAGSAVTNPRTHTSEKQAEILERQSGKRLMHAADIEQKLKEQRLLKKLKSLPAVSFNIIKKEPSPEASPLSRGSQDDRTLEGLLAREKRQSVQSSVKVEEMKLKLLEIPMLQRPVKRPLTPAERTKAYRQRQKMKRLADESEQSITERKSSTQRTREHRERLRLKRLDEEAQLKAVLREAETQRAEYRGRLKLKRLAEQLSVVPISAAERSEVLAQQQQTVVIPTERDEETMELHTAAKERRSEDYDGPKLVPLPESAVLPSVKRRGKPSAEYMRAYRARQKLAKLQESMGLPPKGAKKNSTQRVRAHRERRRIAQVQQLFPEEIAEEYAHWCAGHFLSTHSYENE